jgi:hypothetical protein
LAVLRAPGSSYEGVRGTRRNLGQRAREAWLIVHTNLRSAAAVRTVIDEIKASFGER